MRLTINLSDLRKGDHPAGIPATPSNTVRGVDAFGPLVIVDFEDNTSTAPIPNGRVEIERVA